MFKLFKNIGLAILVIAAIFLFEISKARGADLTTQFAESSTDMWWDPSQDGMGVALKSQNGTVFGAWYNYSPDNRPSFLTFADKVKSDANGRETVVTNLYRTFGPPPKNFAPPVTANAVGSVMLTWAGPGNIILEFTFTDSGTTQTGRMSLVRFQLGADTSAMHYSDRVYALWTDKYPFTVTRTGVTRVKNMTQWSGLGKDLFNCLLANYALADGKILALCKDLAALQWHVVYIDPLKEELREYVGPLPTNLAYTVRSDGFIDSATVGTGWGDVQKFDPLFPTWGAKTQTSNGWYFTPNDQTATLKFQANDGTISTIKAGSVSSDGNVYVMFTYSN